MKFTRNKRRLTMVVLLVVVFVFFPLAHLLTVVTLSPARMDVETKAKSYYERVEFRSESNSLIKGWMIRASNEKGTLLLLHGIRANRLSMLERAEFLVQAGYSALLIDFQAHGESEGDLITLGIKESEDVRAAIKFLRETKKKAKIGVIGSSLGGASALIANISEDINLLILESVFSTIEDAIRNRIAIRIADPLAFFTSLAYFILKYEIDIPVLGLRPIDYMGNLKCPVFIISGKNDLYTFESETVALYQKAPSPKKLWLVAGAGHDDLYAYSRSEYKKRILSFLHEFMR